MEGNYQSTGSRDPIWTRVAGDPRFTQQSRRGNENENENPDSETVLIQGSKSKHGLTVFSAAVLIAGEMAGSGVLALPKAVVDCGWIGLILIIFFCFNAGYSGSRLGVCWTMLEERYPEYRNPVRNPYAIIAQRAVGIWGRRLVSLCIQLTLFGAATVYLLLASQITQELLEDLLPRITYCMWFIVLAACLCPAMWLGSPKDFWAVGLGALITTSFACVLIFTQIVMDGLNSVEPVKHKTHDFSSFFLSFGTILFAFGGASTFPTIQNDMINKKKFPTTVIIGFSVILALFIPVAAGGYFVYGEAVAPNIAVTLSKTPLVSFANILMAIHLILAFLIVINPVCQELEQIFNVPPHFNRKRILLRTVMICIMVLIGETIPSFGKILTLVGGSTVTLLTFVFPSFFYMRLCDQKSFDWPERHIPTFVRVYLWELIIIGIVGGTAATYTAIIAIFSGHSHTVPCYWGL